MTSVTTYYNLILYNSTTDQSALFATFRADLDGTAVGSNMNLIDTALHGIQTQVTTLQSTPAVVPVSATFSSGTLYTATASGIASYVNNSLIVLDLDTTVAGAVTININSLGVVSLIKKNSSGSTAAIQANDLGKNRRYLFQYNTGSASYIWVNAQSGDQISLQGTSGSVATISSAGYLDGTVTQSVLISGTTHAATSKATPTDTDELGVLDNTASFGLKKLTWANLKATLLTSLGAMIDSATGKTTPVGGDEIVIADSASSSATKKVTITNLFGILGVMIDALTAKTTPIAADEFVIADTASSNASKKVTISNLFATLGGFIDGFTAKSLPVAADEFAIADSAASNTVKKVTFTSLTSQLGVFVDALTAKTTPVGGDEFIIADSAASFVSKKISLTNIKASIASDGGWNEVSSAWTYASPYTINIPSDGTLTYQKGDYIRWKQGGGYKYGVIRVITATLITIFVNSQWIVANSAITNIAYSRSINPYGWPTWFSIIDTDFLSLYGLTGTGGSIGAFSMNYDGAAYRVVGKSINYVGGLTITNKGSWSGTVQMPMFTSIGEVANLMLEGRITASATLNPKGWLYANSAAGSALYFHKTPTVNLQWTDLAINDYVVWNAELDWV